MTMTRILGVIPARAGSQGVPKKNIKLLNGKPLIAYTIAAARRARLLDEFIVSTESEEIARIARRFGAPVPFYRPAKLATDTATTLSVLQNTLKEYERLTKRKFSHVLLLQPTTPLRTARDIDRAIRRIQTVPGKRSLISCYNGEGVHPRIMYTHRGKKTELFVTAKTEMSRRQNFEEVYVRNGAIYLIPRELLLKGKMIGTNPILVEMPRWRSINIDNPGDFEMAGIILKYGKTN